MKYHLSDKDGAHLKIYASECLQMIEALGAFCEAALLPNEKLQEECRCFGLLVRIAYILRSGDRAAGRLGLLQELLQQHHDAYLRLYPDCEKPKLH